jgi:Holliday junction resolvasome RuvABC endonuclease subunit
MSGVCAEHGRVMGFHPTARGFGWVVFEGPFRPIDWGLVSARKDKNATCLKRLDGLLGRFAPEVLVLEAYDRESSRRARRIARLGASVRRVADVRGVETVVYHRAQVREAFSETGARTRRQIAEAVARHLDAFRHRLPPPRKPWDSEDAREALFAAAAVVLTHQRSGR